MERVFRQGLETAAIARVAELSDGLLSGRMTGIKPAVL